MAFFNHEDRYLDQAWKCLVDTIPGTPVNDSKFTKPGQEIAHFEYLYLLRVAEISHNVWIAGNVYAQHYNWSIRRGLWVSEKALADTAKLLMGQFEECSREAIDKKWLVQGKDWKSNKTVWFPAIGISE